MRSLINKKMEDKKQAVERRKMARTQKIRIEKKEDNIMKRVSAKVIDMDWIFREGNAKKLLGFLTKQTNSNIYTTNSIRVFIDLLWKKFQPKIIMEVFVPYLLYMISFVLLCSSLTTRLLNHIIAPNAYKEITSDIGLVLTVLLLCGFCCYGWYKLFILEWKQIREDPQDYFSDFWNYIDFLSLIINITYLICLSINVLSWKDKVEIPFLR